ncbi:histone deacetylase family protein [Ceratobasidium sp. AG-Ba]|nr:histone deacetylase family protein [Ceratobasidium sp. AG-Ba]QRW02358.1 histone deacetylase family protein [Ceratobasidium sp. AG-Ba]
MATELETAAKSVDHTKASTTPFLLRTFVRSGGFHPQTVFDEGRLPTLDEHAVHVWGDSTLHDVIRSLRAQAPSPSLPANAFRNPGTKYSFRLIFFDRGAVTSKDLGNVGPRDLNDLAALHPTEAGQTPTPPVEPTELPTEDAMDADDDGPRRDRVDEDLNPKNPSSRRSKTTIRTMDDLRVQAGDWLSVSITIPASAKPAPAPTGLAIRGAEREREEIDGGGHWRGGGGGGGRGRPAGLVRGGGHLAAARERDGPGPGGNRDRPPHRDFSPPRRRDGPPGPERRGGGYGRRPSPDMTRGGTTYRDSRSRSRERRSRSPVGRRRNGRYERD